MYAVRNINAAQLFRLDIVCKHVNLMHTCKLRNPISWHRQSVAMDYLCQEKGHWMDSYGVVSGEKVVQRWYTASCTCNSMKGIGTWKLMLVLAIALVHLCVIFAYICYIQAHATQEHGGWCAIQQVQTNTFCTKHVLQSHRNTLSNNMCCRELTQGVHFPETHSKRAHTYIYSLSTGV